jgi:hypothetical protein
LEKEINYTKGPKKIKLKEWGSKLKYKINLIFLLKVEIEKKN